MKRFDDPMFEAFNETFSNFQPEVPAGAYAGIRNKMKKGGFWAFSFTSLNVYTVSALIIAAAAITWTGTNQGGQASGNLIQSIDRPDATLNKIHHHLVESQKDEISNEEMHLTSFDDQQALTSQEVIACSSPCTPSSVSAKKVLCPLVPVRHEEIKAYDLAKDASMLTKDFEAEVNEPGAKEVQSHDVKTAKELLESAQQGDEAFSKLTLTSTIKK